MNAIPPIPTNRGKVIRQKVVQKMLAQRAQAAPGAQAAGGGRLALGNGRSRLPIPHLTRQAHLDPRLIASLGIGGAGIPDRPDMPANAVSGNILTQGDAIPDWNGIDPGGPMQPATQAGGGDVNPGGPMQPVGGSPYSPVDPTTGQPTTVTPSTSPWIGSVSPSDAGGMYQAPDSGQSNVHGWVSLGNGLWYDPVNEMVRGSAGMDPVDRRF